jgi:membrane protein implicated in regulation of membrane protease activity
MDAWVIWLIVAVVFGVGEIATLGFFLAPFAAGALVAALVSGAGGGDIVSWMCSPRCGRSPCGTCARRRG